MSNLVFIEAEKRTKSGKGEARRLRAAGQLPGVLYGKEVDNIKLSVKIKDLEKLLHTGGEGGLISLKLAGDKDYHVMIRDVQNHPLGKYTHVDFYQVSLKDKLITEVPIYLTGEPEGLKGGGILQQPLRAIEVECLPTNIPEKIEVDVSELEMGDSISVKEIQPPEGVEVMTDSEETIAVLAYPQVEAEEDTEKEEVTKEATEEQEGEAEEQEE
ncbi:large subunit ribosomal protein L25 [Desulfitispora alkaliphila]|uniref:50S ribosomal protein L25/general stress protein Ctc n=1 Tax=Desulfitispora alkaliphila TaxID=622674 RepID=UPI003D25B972